MPPGYQYQLPPGTPTQGQALTGPTWSTSSSDAFRPPSGSDFYTSSLYPSPSPGLMMPTKPRSMSRDQQVEVFKERLDLDEGDEKDFIIWGLECLFACEVSNFNFTFTHLTHIRSTYTLQSVVERDREECGSCDNHEYRPGLLYFYSINLLEHHYCAPQGSLPCSGGT